MINNGQAPQVPVAPLPRNGPGVPGPTSLREVMRQFATGITVLTVGGARCHGMTANAFSSVSLDPPMVLCCVARTARMHQSIAAARSFGVSILRSDQQEVARYFTDRRRPDGVAQFDAVDWWPGAHTGAPLLSGALAWLECSLSEVYEGGDHSIFLGDVVSASFSSGRDALLFFGGEYHGLEFQPAAEAR